MFNDHSNCLIYPCDLRNTCWMLALWFFSCFYFVVSDNSVYVYVNKKHKCNINQLDVKGYVYKGLDLYPSYFEMQILIIVEEIIIKIKTAW